MRPIAITILTFVLLALLPGSLSAYSLFLRGRVLIKGDAVYMRDIARVEGEVTDGLISGKLILSNPRKPFYISRRELKKRLKPGPEKLEWIYGSGVWIIPLNRSLDGKSLLELLRKQIGSRAGGRKFLEKTTFKLKDPNLLVEVPDEIQLKYKLPSKLKLLKPGQHLITLALRSDNKTFYRYQIPLTIYHKRRVAYATRTLKVGERLKKGDWIYREIETDRISKHYLTVYPGGRRVMGPIGAGEALTKRNVHAMPAVRRGQNIQVVYQTSHMIIQVRSIARKGGQVGETIPVRVLLPSGNRGPVINARIVGEGVAVLESKNVH